MLWDVLQGFLRDFAGGARGILVILAVAALFALGGYILLDVKVRVPTPGGAPYADE